MDTKKLIMILRATLDPEHNKEAEEQLAQAQKIIGYAPSLLQVVMMNDVVMPVRQAGAICLKKLVTTGWQDREAEEGEPMPFTIHEQDKAMIRDSIIEAIVQSPELIRFQLCNCLKTIIKNDFPKKWTQIVDKIHICLQNVDDTWADTWMGALLCLYQLIKNYTYQISEKRVPLIEAMNLLLPMTYNIMNVLQADQSKQSVLIQKQILKNFFALISFSLPLELITKPMFSNWMEVLRRVMEQPVPEETLQVNEQERINLPWWKLKKWAGHCLVRIFDRYGSPVNAQEGYVEFSEWYLTTFTGGILDVLLRILDQYRRKIYVSPRVLQRTINYIDRCISHSHSWKLLKPHMFDIIKDVLFPLMSYSDADDELWNEDPHEYIGIKFDMFEDMISPVAAARTLLISCCKKRKDMLQRTVHLCMQVLTNQNGEYGPREKDGALRMVGTVSDILMKKDAYKNEIDTLLSQYVFPEFNNPLGHMRATACWVVHCFSAIRFKNDELLLEACRLLVNAVLTESDLPVKVEAAIGVQLLLKSQEKVHKFIEPQIKPLTLELLKLIRDTENDSLSTVLQKIVPLYTEQLMGMAVEITDHLANTFSNLIQYDSGSDEKALTAMGLLNTIETILTVMLDNPEIMAQLEKIVLRVAVHILHDDNIQFYEEALSLICNLTTKSVSKDMWNVLEVMFKVFENDGFDFFTDMMPALHNYIVIDTNAFLSEPGYIVIMFNIVKAVLNSDSEEESEMYATKLLEVMVLQCAGRIDHCLPWFVELVLNRLTKKVKTSELRTMLLQVLIAILYCNPELLFTILEKLQMSVPNTSITQHFIKQWIHDIDCFMGIHDRKLCILGICTLFEYTPARGLLGEVLPQLLPSCLVLFDGLKRAYEAVAEADDSGSSDDDDDDEIDNGILESDEDDVDEMNNAYLENLARMATKNSAAHGIELNATIEDEYDGDDNDDDDDDDYEPDGNPIIGYTTPLDDEDCPVDEYMKFKTTLTLLQSNDPAFYHVLTSGLTKQQQSALEAVFVLADQRKAQQDSKRIEQSGGYSFTVPAQVPTTFKFGS